MNWKIVNNIFTSEELDKMCEYFDTHGELVKGSTPMNSSKWRISDVCFYDRKNKDVEWIFKKLDTEIIKNNNKHFGFKLNAYDFFQYSVYNDFENGQYRFHMDTTESQSKVRKLSISLILNEQGVDFEGGDFVFNMANENKPCKVELTRGSMILFPSYLLHAVTPVTKGTRKSVVIWVEGPSFV